MPLPIGIPPEAGPVMAPHLANQLHNLQLRGSRVETVKLGSSSHQRLFYQLCCYATPATTVMTAPGIYTDRASSKHKLSPICQLFMRLPKCRDLRNFRLENCFQLAGGGHGANMVTMIIHWRPCGYGGYLVLVAGAGAALLAVRQLRRGDHVWSFHRVRRPLQLRRGHRRDVYFLSLFAGAKMSRLRHFFCRRFVQLRWPAQWRW